MMLEEGGDELCNLYIFACDNGSNPTIPDEKDDSDDGGRDGDNDHDNDDDDDDNELLSCKFYLN